MKALHYIPYISFSSQARLSEEWRAPIYAFFEPLPAIEYMGKRNSRVHTFKCTLATCKRPFVWWYLDTTDRRLTVNMRNHAWACWGKETVTGADNLGDVDAARKLMKGDSQSSITDAFKRIPLSKISYSQRQHTNTQIRSVHVP